jgi:hypothetical protein
MSAAIDSTAGADGDVAANGAGCALPTAECQGLGIVLESGRYPEQAPLAQAFDRGLQQHDHSAVAAAAL